MPFKLPTVHTTKLYMHVAYSYRLNEQGTCIAHSSLPLIHTYHVQQQLFHNVTYTPSYRTDHIPYIPSTAHGLHSFCIQARQTISAMLSIASKYIVHCSHPQHNPHHLHINMHSPHCLPEPSAHN